MNPNRKRRPKGPLVPELIKTFENELNSFVRELSKNNHYAAFLYEQFLRDLKKLANKNDPKINNANLTSHCLPITSEFKFLPLQIYLGDPAYDLEIEMNSLWIKEGKDQGSLDVLRDEYYAQKKSRIIRKIFDLSKNFSHWIEEIHKKSGIPVHSLTEIYSVVTSEEKLVPLFQDGFRKEWVSTPNNIAVEQRDTDLSKISKQIYNLLVESFFVSIVSGMEDSLIVFSYLHDNDFQKAQKYLLEMACYFFLEERVRSAGSVDDLREYLEEELSTFLTFLKPFHIFFKKYAQPLIKKGVLLREKPFKFPSDPSSVREQSKYANYAYVESIKDKAFKTIFGKGNSQEETSGVHEEELFGDYEGQSEDTEDGNEDAGFSETEVSEFKPVDYLFEDRARDFGDSYPSRKTRGKTREKEEGGEDDASTDAFKYEKEGFFYEMFEILMKKWRTGLISGYELRGDPLSVISFLEGIFSKVGLTVIGKDYNERVKPTEGRSLRTKRRDEKEKREGKIDKDLSTEEIRPKKKESQKHRVEGYWTLNQLIKELVDRGQGTRTTLMRKIKKLPELNRIQFSKEDGIYRFEESEENLNEIARQISKL